MENNTITSITDAIELIKSDEFESFRRINPKTSPNPPVYKQPFGIWFRGEADNRWELSPSVFREGKQYDETSMFYHFQSRTGYREQCRNTFDWLCLMRHFELPTRLLDWSENLLTALFFASNDPIDSDGKLYILNAVKLNRHTRTQYEKENLWNLGIGAPISVDTAIRAEMTRARSSKEFRDIISSFNRDYIEDNKSMKKLCSLLDEDPKKTHELLNTPIAVLPHRIDTRLVLQQSAFTIHGGKIYDSKGNYNIAPDIQMPGPKKLDALNNKQLYSDRRFLLSKTVTNKRTIRDELKYLGIHEGSLFPELDRQSRYIEKLWSLENF